MPRFTDVRPRQQAAARVANEELRLKWEEIVRKVKRMVQEGEELAREKVLKFNDTDADRK